MKKYIGIHPVSIFVKLGRDNTDSLDGFQTMKEYGLVNVEKGETWFSTNSLPMGISDKRKEEFFNAIAKGYCVQVFFVIGKSGGGVNEIEYTADVVDIRSRAGGRKSPCEDITPTIWEGENNAIWLKLQNIRTSVFEGVEDFKFDTNSKQLSDVLKTNCCFGYIVRN